MATTISKLNLGQTLLSALVLFQLIGQKIGKDIGDRLAQGDSPEAVLEDFIEAARQSKDGDGLANLLSVVLYVENDQLEEALHASQETQRTWAEVSPVMRMVDGVILTALRRYDDSFAAFEDSHHDFCAMLASPEVASSAPSSLGQLHEDFYMKWALAGIMQGLEGILAPSLKDLEDGRNKAMSVLRYATEDGQEDAIWKAMDRVEEGLPPEQRRGFQEFRRYMELLTIEDPFEGLRELSRSISEAWPEGVDCVEAVREQRR